MNNCGKKKDNIIWKFIKPYKISFLLMFINVTIISFISMIYPFLIGMMIDEVFYHKNFSFFIILAVLYVIFFVGENSILFVQVNIWSYLQPKFLFDIRKKLLEKIIYAKPSFLSDIRTGDLIACINNDTNEILYLIHFNIFHLINIFLRFLMSVMFILLISYKLLILMVVTIPLATYISLFFAKKINKKSSEYRKRYGNYISWTFEILNGLRDVKIFSGDRSVTRKFVKYCSDMIRLKIKVNLTQLASERLISLIVLISDLSLYIISAYLYINNSLTIGGFIAVISYFGMANLAFKQMNEANIDIQNRLVSVKKVMELLIEEGEEYNKNLTSISIPRGQIEYSNVSFNYNNEEQVLKNISLNINSGEQVAIVGKSGTGKSTMISLLLRFFNLNEGVIKIDGTDISKCSLKSLRENVGVVHQNVLIFDGTIRYNLSLSKKNCSEHEIWDACNKAYATEFIKNLPNGLDTVVGRGGISLSGGQKQRIAIARIIIKNPKILVFDEATSSLDYEAEKAVQSAWKSLREGKTTIVIAHRLSTVLHSDRVAVLHEGNIISYDHHLKLLKDCIYYRDLFQEQYLGYERTS
jgi:ATP-binding cassette subfamily B protein